ncbi:16S rRNA (uracil(1498)-N(3))-methyltransferase [uncultured Finegoldia sp.]|uniref:RsmE family RNA methyltransferase n=1 Tax=uncultured Finegoldia sp. TaxID=328009 RepID=UPI0026228DCE|nr:RsmE family RNA methyltransferase [uncultured Finegoldia sp.]
MYRTFREAKDKINNKIYIYGDDYNHIKNSLRLNKGDLIHQVIDDKIYITKIESIESDKIISEIIGEDTTHYESNININLFQCILKSDKNDYIIQKCTELGVNEITFVQTERTVVKIENTKWAKKKNRFEKIALEASKQSKRIKIPKIKDIISISDIPVFENSLNLVFYEKETEDLKSVLQKCHFENINIVIGPEGGLSDNNIAMLKQKGFISVSLGKRILRADTAPICALSILQYEIGDIN